MTNLLIDTNAAIAVINGNSAAIKAVDSAETIAIPIIVIGELCFGAEKSTQVAKNLSEIQTFLQGRNVLLCDLETATWYGKVAQRLRAKGRPIPQNDMWIAAIALRYDLTLMTKDEHFSEVEGLKVQGW